MAKIISLGEWFPSTVRKNNEWSQEIVESFQKHMQRELVDVLDENPFNIDQYSLEGFKSEINDPFVGSVERRVADENMASHEAETLAGIDAVKKAGIDPLDIEGLYIWSLTPDIPNMTCANLVAQNIGMKNFFGFGFEGACASVVGQLMTAKALIDTQQVKFVLLIQSHLMTRACPMTHPASPNIGDCATAMLIGPDDYEGHIILSNYARSHGEHYNSIAWRRKDGDQLWLSSGGPYFLGSFDKNKAKELIQGTVKFGAQTTIEALARLNMTPKDIDFFISVNPRKWIPGAIVKTLGLSEDKTLNTFEKYSHLGGCGAPANLNEANKLGLLKVGDIVAMYSQGAGFTRGVSIIKW